MKVFSAAVIGLGRIGQGYDYDRPDRNHVLTHANAFKNHPGFQLIAGVDPVLAQRERFEKKFARPAYPDLRTLFSKENPQVLSIAVPTALHFQIFKEVIEHAPTAIICEKPLAACIA